MGANCFHLAEALMTDDEEVITLRGCAVLSGVDLFVCAIHSHSQDLHQDTAPIGDIVDRGIGQFRQMNRVGLAGEYCDGFM